MRFSAPTFVTTDASDVGLGAVVSQIQNGQEIPVEFASHTLEEHERSYATNELEAYGCVWACENWVSYLTGIHFTLRTDHQALTAILNPKRPPAKKYKLNKFQGWVERLSVFSYDVEYRQGSLNLVADALSRAPVKQSQAESDPTCISALSQGGESGMNLKEIRKATDQDPTLKKVEKMHSRIILLSSMVKQALVAAHRGHPGVVRMKKTLCEAYWWPQFNDTIESHVRHCGPCQASAKTDPPEPKTSNTLAKPTAPWQLVAIDVCGPFHTAPERQRFLVVLIDHFSSYPEVLTTGIITAAVIIGWLEEVFSRLGYPDYLLSDNGTQFTGAEFQQYLGVQGITHLRTPVYNPQANGKVENFNKYLKHGIQAKSPDKIFQKSLNDLLLSYRATSVTSEKESPAQLLFKRKIRLPFHPVRRTLDTKDPPATKHQEKKQPAYSHLIQRRPFRSDDKVLTKRPQVLKGQSPWSAPLTVIEILDDYTAYPTVRFGMPGKLSDTSIHKMNQRVQRRTTSQRIDDPEDPPVGNRRRDMKQDISTERENELFALQKY